MAGHDEAAFESAIEAGLTRVPKGYDESLALFPEDVTGFLQDSQPSKWMAMEALLRPKTATTVLDSLSKELELKGTLHVLRHGFKYYGALIVSWTSRVDERERSPPNPAPALVDCAALVHPTAGGRANR